MAEPIKITSVSQFQSLLSSHEFVVVDFWAEWCPPCKAMSPIFSKMAASHSVPGRLAFAKVDLEETPEIPEEHGVSSIPAFLFFQDGEPTPLDLGGRVKPGPTVQLDETQKKLKRIVGADPKNLMLVVGELAKRAKEEKAGGDDDASKQQEEKKNEGKGKDKETAIAPPPASDDKKDEPNPLFAKEDEDW